MLVLWMANRGALLMGESSIQLINIFQFSLVRFQFLKFPKSYFRKIGVFECSAWKMIDHPAVNGGHI